MHHAWHESSESWVLAAPSSASILDPLGYPVENVIREWIEKEGHNVARRKVKFGCIEVKRKNIKAFEPGSGVVSDILASISVQTARKLHSDYASKRQSSRRKYKTTAA